MARLLVGALLLPVAPAHAVRPEKPQTGFSASGLMALEGFRNLVMTIAMVNHAMRVAAENPMDDWRRQNVRTAMSLMPGAVAGMAKHFYNGQLGNGDLPGIQAMLGGFVDKNAGDAYKKFMMSPDKRLIPKVGANFPNVTPPPVPQSAGPGNVASTSKAGPTSGGAQIGSVGKTAVDSLPTGQMVSSTQRREAKTINTQTVVMNDNAAKGATMGSPAQSAAAQGTVEKPAVDAAPKEIFGNLATASGSTRGPASVSAVTTEPGLTNRVGLPYVGSQTVMEASREMTSIERRGPASTTETPSTLTIIRPADGKKTGNDLNEKEFFEDFGKDEVAKNKNKILKKKGEGRRPATKPTTYRAPSHLLRYFSLGLSLLTSEARAEGEEGDREGKSGGDALMGIAMILAAVMPAIAAMVVASTQANADKAIAKTNADAQIKMTEISAATQKEANQIAKDVAIQQSNTAREVAEMNNGAVTDRLQMQLAELRSARGEAAQAERERRALDEQYNQQRIALAEKQSQQNLDLAKETLAAQLSEAGLRQSFSNSTNSGDRLQTTTVTPSAGTNATRLATGLGDVAATGAAVANGTNLGQAATSTRTNADRLGLASVSTSDRAPASTSLSGSSTGLSLQTRSGGTTRGFEGTGSAESEDRFLGVTYGDENVKACKGDAANKSKADIEACLKRSASKRGIKSSPRDRLTKRGALASNNGGRGFAGRLNDAMNMGIIGSTPTNLQTGTSASGGSLAFRSDANQLNKGSSFGDFVAKRAAGSQNFISYRAEESAAGQPNRDRNKGDAAITGGHQAQPSRGIRGLID